MTPRIALLPALSTLALAFTALFATGCDLIELPFGGCEPGERRMAPDDCNTCVCEAGGWACTEMACQPPPDCMCPAVYAPVCGADGQTYGNACEAGCAEVEVEAEGTCDGACPDPADPDVSYLSDDPRACALIDFACGGDARPFADDCGCGCIANDPAVCGEGEIMHGNECLTLCDADEGCPDGTACGGCYPDPGCPECEICLLACEPVPAPIPECACPEIYAPVCGEDGRTYGNACAADCADVDIDFDGECEPPCRGAPGEDVDCG